MSLFVLSVHHLAVRVADLDRAEAFYRGLIGLPLIRRWTDDAGAPRSFWLALGADAFLAVELTEAVQGDLDRKSAPQRALRGWHCVALGITSGTRNEWKTKLIAAGVSIERETDYTFYVRDPDGNLVAFSHYPDAKPNPSSTPAKAT